MSHAQEKLPAEYYKAAHIPDSLKKNANFVTRYENYEVIVKNVERAVQRQHIIMTLLNEKAEDNATFIMGYDDKFYSIKSAEMLIYDADGELIKRYKKSDMYDQSSSDGGMTLVSDNRVLYLKHTVVSYPVTVEMKYEYQLDTYLSLGAWHPQEKDNSVQVAKCKVVANPEVGFRYQQKYFKNAVKQVVDGQETYSWEVANLKAFKVEPGAQSWTFMPRLSFATNKISFGDIDGDISTWKGFGIWQQKLNTGLAELPPARVEELKQMVASLPSDKEKAKFLYGYMQKNMRYVGIQLGIGGWKPFPASFVDTKKYGDCKALSNYMHALLKAVGVPSYYAVVRAGKNESPADPNFVTNPFNHIILCIPFKSDTTWLECTSNTAVFGKPGTFTENRNALLITEDGGKLVNTPRSKKEDNVFDSNVEIVIDEEGVAKTKMSIAASGEFRNELIRISYKDTDNQKKEVISLLSLKQPDVFDLAAKEDQGGIKNIELDLEHEKLSEFAAGAKSFYRPGIFDLWQETYPATERRKTDFFFSHPMIKKCRTVFKLPLNQEVEALPPDVALTFSYGNYQAKYLYDKEKNQVTAVTQFDLNNHVIPAAKYNEMQAFMDNVVKSMSKKLILRKKA